MNCGSMNARALAGTGVFYLPDPWCNNEPAWPTEIEVFKTVRGQIGSRKYEGRGTGRKRVATIHDVSASPRSRSGYGSSGIDAAQQRAAFAGSVKWRRVALADRLQFDLFRHYYRRMRPDFATFFINSTAHLQHAYRRHMDPDAFPLKPAKDEIESYGDAVLFGYRSMDALLRRFFALAQPDTTIILCSAPSQQPFLKREGRGGQHFYRLRDISHFLQLLDIAPRMVEPVMTHQYLLRFADRAGAERALAVLRQLKLGEETVFGARLTGTDIHFGCQIYERLEGNREIGGCPDATSARIFSTCFMRLMPSRARAIIPRESFGCIPANTQYTAGRRRYSISPRRSTI
jgi:hypothetical protein